MIAADAAKASVLLFLTVIVQISILSQVTIVHGRPQLLLVTVTCIALLRGAIFAAVAGFLVGFVADSGTFGMLGFTSLLLTLAGYWTGRYGETTGRDRAHAPIVAVAVTTALYQLGALLLHVVLGEPASGRDVLLVSLVPTIVLNLLLTYPVYALVRRLLPPSWLTHASREVQLLG